jgi:hypothetical protein
MRVETFHYLQDTRGWISTYDGRPAETPHYSGQIPPGPTFQVNLTREWEIDGSRVCAASTWKVPWWPYVAMLDPLQAESFRRPQTISAHCALILIHVATWTAYGGKPAIRK